MGSTQSLGHSLAAQWRKVTLIHPAPSDGPGVPMEALRVLGRKLTKLPSTLHAHKHIRSLYDARRQMIETGERREGGSLSWTVHEGLICFPPPGTRRRGH